MAYFSVIYSFKVFLSASLCARSYARWSLATISLHNERENWQIICLWYKNHSKHRMKWELIKVIRPQEPSWGCDGGGECSVWGGSMLQTPRDKGEMTWEIWSFHVRDMEFEGVSWWKEDSRRQAPNLEQPCDREFWFYPVLHRRIIKEFMQKESGQCGQWIRIRQYCHLGDILVRSLQESSGEAMLLRI